MAIDYTALKTELQTDPVSLGYAPTVANGQDGITAGVINLVRAGASFSLFLASIAATDVQAALDPTEFATLTATQLNQLSVMLAGGTVNAGSANVRSIMTSIFSPAGSFPTTRANLLAAVKRQGSRAEVLFGIGTAVAAADVAKALRG